MPWQRVASIAELEAASPWLGVQVGRVELAIAVVDGSPYAVQDRCTHAGCAFSEDAELIRDVISCFCHGSEFDIRTGEVRRGPAEDPIQTFPIRVAGDAIEVEVEDGLEL
jgi:nitrite reductase/ring-hydroxylating ferredoxin subunit